MRAKAYKKCHLRSQIIFLFLRFYAVIKTTTASNKYRNKSIFELG